jgi:hypothetical protein
MFEFELCYSTLNLEIWKFSNNSLEICHLINELNVGNEQKSLKQVML